MPTYVRCWLIVCKWDAGYFPNCLVFDPLRVDNLLTFSFVGDALSFAVDDEPMAGDVSDWCCCWPATVIGVEFCSDFFNFCFIAGDGLILSLCMNLLLFDWMDWGVVVTVVVDVVVTDDAWFWFICCIAFVTHFFQSNCLVVFERFDFHSTMSSMAYDFVDELPSRIFVPIQNFLYLCSNWVIITTFLKQWINRLSNNTHNAQRTVGWVKWHLLFYSRYIERFSMETVEPVRKVSRDDFTVVRFEAWVLRNLRKDFDTSSESGFNTKIKG